MSSLGPLLILLQPTLELRSPTASLRRRLGASLFEVLERARVLVPGGLTLWYPCVRSLGDCVRHVATAPRGGAPFIAVCPRAEACPNEDVPETALDQHVFSRRAFLDIVRPLFAVTAPSFQEAEQPGVVCIGAQADGRDVYLCFAPDAPGLAQWLRTLEETAARLPLVLVTTHAPEATTARVDALERIEVFYLDRELVLMDGRVRRRPSIEQVVAPCGLQWADVSVFLIDDHTVRIRVGDRVPAAYTAGDLGLVDQRTRAPSTGWRLLVAILRR